MTNTFNAPFSNWVRSAFRFCGYIGLGLGIGTALVLGWHAHLSLGVILLMAVTAATASFAVVVITMGVVGGERWVFYHHALAVTSAVVLLLRLLGQPLLPYLDLAAISLAVLLACGRVGCFLVGCCHGTPSDWGVRYGAKHVAAGFPGDLAGVRLLPVQILEGLWVAAVAAVGSGLIWTGSPAGTALSWCLIAYGGARFVFEFWRGDRDRPTPWGLCEAQWTSLLLVAMATICQLAHWLPYTPWQLAAALAWAVVVVTIFLWQRRQPVARRLLQPNHVREMAFALDRLSTWRRLQPTDEEDPHLERTSEGIQISSSRIAASEASLYVYTLSCAEGEMEPLTARALARIIGRLRHPGFRFGLVARTPGIFHLIMDLDSR
jgi:hypothetical protein